MCHSGGESGTGKDTLSGVSPTNHHYIIFQILLSSGDGISASSESAAPKDSLVERKRAIDTVW
jgi:hypothetical protein